MTEDEYLMDSSSTPEFDPLGDFRDPLPYELDFVTSEDGAKLAQYSWKSGYERLPVGNLEVSGSHGVFRAFVFFTHGMHSHGSKPTICAVAKALRMEGISVYSMDYHGTVFYFG